MMPAQHQSPNPAEAVKAFLVCPGLGHVRRGYESFTQECFDVLRDRPELELTLYKGAGENEPRVKVLPVLRRQSNAARWLSAIVGQGPFFAEALSFSLQLIGQVAWHRPSVVYYSDYPVGQVLWYWRKLTGARFALLFCNGAPLEGALRHCDHIHQCVPAMYDKAIQGGQPRETMTLLPQGFHTPATLDLPTAEQKRAIRLRHGLPPDARILLSVGMLTAVHKRMDYVIREVAAVERSIRPFLLLLGQRDADTPAIEQLAMRELGPDGCKLMTVKREQMDDFYAAADCFTLGSLAEGFGRVQCEAMAHGLTCLANDCPPAKYVLGDAGKLANFTQPGALAGLVRAEFLSPPKQADRERIHRSVRDRFSWTVLAEEYSRMIRRCAHPSVAAAQLPNVDPTEALGAN
jgi:1,2-diacylglycerol 3-alpha-glucosyltransferase